MKKTILLSILVILFSCTNHPPQVVYVQQPIQPVALQQQTYQGDPNSFYNDPQYANQPPILYNYNGQQMLIDAALMAYLTTYNITPYSYYVSHPGYTHFHIYSNGGYVGYPHGYHNYITVNHYHYIAPNPRYVTKSGSPDMRYKANRVVTPVRQSNFNTPNASARSFSSRSVTTPIRSGGFGHSSSISSSHSNSSFGRRR